MCSRGSSGGGSTSTLTIDSGDASRSVSGIPIIHADAGVDLLSQSAITRCSIGNTFGGGFQGPAIAIRGNHANSPKTNANSWLVSNTRCLGCRNAIFDVGVDTNSGVAVNVVGVQTAQWNFVDLSQTGVTFVTCHVHGGYGWIGIDSQASSNLFGCYAEEGSASSLGTNAIAVGGVSMLTLAVSRLSPED